jgi:hypothetical protein
LEWVFIWIVCGIITALIGSRKGLGFFSFFYGLILGPLGILIAIFTVGDRKECSFCKELIHKDATVCPHCQRDVKAEKKG